MPLQLHNGQRFSVTVNQIRGSWLVLCKTSGRWVYCCGDQGHQMSECLLDGWNKFGMAADADDVWQWIWVNCGWYRLSSGV